MRFFQLAKARVHEILALLGHVVFGVFAQVAHRDRLLISAGNRASARVQAP